jgi:hypothetical protein
MARIIESAILDKIDALDETAMLFVPHIARLGEGFEIQVGSRGDIHESISSTGSPRATAPP